MIVAHDVSLALDGRAILERVSLTIGRGESVALVGPNGSGKTSLLRCLLGFVPFTGRATIEGHDVLREPIVARALLGYVPQHAAFGDERARDVLVFVAKLRRIEPARVRSVLALTGLLDHADEWVRTFSGGMRQRLALAVALLPDPPTLLFDEPTANLDHDGQHLFGELVARLRRDGHTLVLASHRTEEVATLTDRAIHLDRGRLFRSDAGTRRVVPFPARGELR